MSDPRSTPDPERAQFRHARKVTGMIVDLLRKPDGARDRQLLFGDPVWHLATLGDWAYVQSQKDGYCGYLRRQMIGDGPAPSHWVTAPSSTAYLHADMKSPDLRALSFGSLLHVFDDTKDFVETDLGFVPIKHVAPLAHRLTDPAGIAERFLGTPYLWGGNSRWGIDCSGLVQAALLACGLPCPGDSDQQMSLGEAATSPNRRNDLLFWKGHVALLCDAQTLIHANAHAMAVTYEPISDAIARIEAAGDGPVTAHRRLPALSG